MDDLRYPIGRFHAPSTSEPAQRDEWIEQIADAPSEMKRVVVGLAAERLDTPYRPEGWTVRQVIHHVADSHVNAYCRFRIALTEDEPTIRAYEQARWAELPDAHDGPVEASLELLAALHARWVALLRTL
ncbi:MAG TPA: putative metal-dependent hydrolase, partial [Candidatus Krumholzibacteria bacterium]